MRLFAGLFLFHEEFKNVPLFTGRVQDCCHNGGGLSFIRVEFNVKLRVRVRVRVMVMVMVRVMVGGDNGLCAEDSLPGRDLGDDIASILTLIVRVRVRVRVRVQTRVRVSTKVLLQVSSPLGRKDRVSKALSRSGVRD